MTSRRPLQPPHVHAFKDRHGHVRYYLRKPGLPRMTLPGLPYSPEFMVAYHHGLAGTREPIGASRTGAGTINALAVAYYTSANFAGLAKVTKQTYRNVLERFRAEHGDKPVALLQRKHVLGFLDAKASTPAAANALLKILRILMRFAIDRDMRQDDPTLGVRRLRYATDGFREWTEEDISTFEAYWPTGSRPRLAFALLLYTGQRPGDVSRMGRQHVQGSGLAFTQHKTGTRLYIPMHVTLVAELDRAKVGGALTFLITEQGAGFSEAGFSQWFSERARMATLPAGCTAHGLRKSAANRLAAAGCTLHQIAAITGHKTLKEIERYTRGVDQRQLATVAMETVGLTGAKSVG
jgi:integrase